MSVKEKIFKIMEQYEEHGIYREIEINGEWEEISLEEKIEEILSKEESVTDFQVKAANMFNNLGIDVYSVSIVWIENGKLETILNYGIDKF
jgi:tRNA(Ser,Leu) C12 N-acetylase TAN1